MGTGLRYDHQSRWKQMEGDNSRWKNTERRTEGQISLLHRGGGGGLKWQYIEVVLCNVPYGKTHEINTWKCQTQTQFVFKLM